MKIKIATWNVNSIRSRIPNILNWIKISNPDIILIQELKCLEEQFPYFEFETLGYNIQVCGQKAYNGVAIFSKFKLDEVKKTLPLYDIEKEEDFDARYIEALIAVNGINFTIASAYIPNGTEGKPDKGQKLDETEKFYHKLRFYSRLKRRFEESISNNEKLIIGGDFNTCPELIDMYSIKKDGDICCNKKEREKLKEIFDINIFDILRVFNKDPNIFSWWGYRYLEGWENNKGLRLDLILATANIKNNIISCTVESKETRGEEKPSDHAPVVCIIEI